MSFKKLDASIEKHKSNLCIGLDPLPEKIPEFLSEYEDPVLEFNSRIIEATQDVVCAYKLNTAFYEVLGEKAWSTYGETIARIPDDVYVIADCKRSDIGNSAKHYAQTFFDFFEVDALTVNPYMGYDSVDAFLNYRDKDAFVLVLTSNRGAEDFQLMEFGGKKFYEVVLEKISQWNKEGNIGAVVGATKVEQLSHIRKCYPQIPLLIPGIGAQGGSIESVAEVAGTDGAPVIVNVGRDIIFSGYDEKFADKVREKAFFYNALLKK
ncbi:MAG TPA: orotidine-5'-phosphate decarboxylase [Candidatus Acidoferrales bacterium]|nr:orotidine-5'-phosphate decarboxylase [Candidatus Acidoferrales bacterium]